MTKQSAATRQLSVTEPLDIRLIPDEGLRFEEPISTAWLDALLGELGRGETAFRAQGAGFAAIEVEPLQSIAMRPPIRVSGALTVSVSTTCVRCLQPIEQALEAAVDLTLFAGDARSNREAPPRGDVDLEARDLSEATYLENVLDLPTLLREALLLELAMNPRCADEGACSDRTDALIRDANRGVPDLGDERWAALRRLLEAGGGKSSGNE